MTSSPFATSSQLLGISACSSFRRPSLLAKVTASCHCPERHARLSLSFHAQLQVIVSRVYADEEAAAGPRAPLGVPFWKPFLKRRGTDLSERMRPVPVVFLLLAFSPQLSVALWLVCDSGSLWSTRCWRMFVVGRTLPDAGARVSTVCAGVLLDVERAATCKHRQYFLLRFF